MQDGNRTGNTAYLYNALGERVSKERTGAGRDHVDSRGHARYIYDYQGQLLAEATDGQATKNYVYIDGLPVAMMDGGNVYYIHTDHLGAPQKMTDDRQQIVWDRVSKPFGDTVAIAGTANLNLRFPGQYHDAETGLDYNMFRSYDAALGRYTQSDPIGLAGGINTYGYVGQNPVNLFDLMGLAVDQVCVANVTAFCMALGAEGGMFIGGALATPEGQLFTGAQAGYTGGAVGGGIVGHQLGNMMCTASESTSDSSSAADCSKAIKLLEQAIRLADKLNLNLGEKRKKELQDKINNGTITSGDLPASIAGQMPPQFRGKTLNEIRNICGKNR